MGKITVIKNYALPKLIYALSSLLNPPPQTVKRIEKLMYEFIWDGKPEKIKRDILTMGYESCNIILCGVAKICNGFCNSQC